MTTTTRTRHTRSSHRSTRGGPNRTTTGWPLAARLALRRSRWFWLVWILALSTLLPTTVSAYSRIVPSGVLGRMTIEALSANSTMRAMLGPPFDLTTPGGFAMWRVGTFVAAAAAMMAALGVIRATRAEEEDGRTELLRAGAIGRHAPLTGALVVAFSGCALLGLLVTAGMAADTPPAGSALAVGLGIGLTGAVWAGIGAVAAQISESARAARGIALGSLGAAYLVRAVVDGMPDHSWVAPFAWASPVQWAALARPYADERWWVLLLPLVTTVLLVLLTVRLENRRDHGGGLRATSLGPARGNRALAGPAGLTWRLERPAVLGWTIGMAVFSVAIGSLAGAVDQMLIDNPQLAIMFQRMGAGASLLRDAFYTAMLGILIVVLSFYAAQLLLRWHREEELGHTELMLATAASRTRTASAHLTLALLAPTALLVLTGVLVALPQAVSDGDAGLLAQIAGAALALAPGLWLAIGVGTFLLGCWPRAISLLWLLLGWSLFVTWVGALLNIPQWIIDATPFAALPRLPAESLTWTPIVVETVLAVVLIGLGLLGWRRRDVSTP